MLLLLIVFGGSFCATLDRNSRTTLTASGQLGRSSEGCGGGFSHDQAGGHLHLRHEDTSGLVVTTTLAGMAGAIAEGDGNGGGSPSIGADRAPSRPNQAPSSIPSTFPPYTLSAAGISVGAQLRYIGVEAGLHLIFGPDQESESAEAFMPMPWAAFQLGDLSSGWGEFVIGPRLGLGDQMIVSFGGGFQGRNIRGKVGIGLAGVLLVGALSRSTEIEVDGADPVAFGNLQWVHSSGFGVNLRLVTGQSYAGSIGFVLDLDRLHGAP